MCGAGFATSTIIVNTIQSLLEKRGITNVEIIKERIDKIRDYDPSKIDLIVSGNPIPPDISRGVPVLRSLAFLTGVGIENEIDKIVEILKERGLIE